MDPGEREATTVSSSYCTRLEALAAGLDPGGVTQHYGWAGGGEIAVVDLTAPASHDAMSA